MELLAGLMSHQVLQRNRRNLCETVLAGRSPIAGPLQVRVTANGRVLRGWACKTLARVHVGEFTCVLRGVPVGGPYTIAIRIGNDDPLTFENILVGDVWLLGGQSNMEGLGLRAEATGPHPKVRAFYMDDRWAMAVEPIHCLKVAIDPIHVDLCGGVPMDRGPLLGAGPGIAFGRRMLDRSGVPQGLIGCAHGGASMDQWNPATKDRLGKTLYSAMLRRFWRNGQRVAGLVWYQGCTDTATDESVSAYTTKMKRFVAAVRKDLGLPTLPVIMAQLARLFNSPWLAPGGVDDALRPATIVHWNAIREQQRMLATSIRHLAVVPTIDLPMSDFVHLSGEGQHVLGGRLAEAAWTMKRGAKAQPMPIALKSVRAIQSLTLGTPAWDIEVRFSNVVGSLRSAGLAIGFALTDAVGAFQPQIFHTKLDGDRAILKTSLPSATTKLNQWRVYYGYAPNPACNIVDAAGRSLPAFGPVRIAK
jgi:sialate O-acetylesterase